MNFITKKNSIYLIKYIVILLFIILLAIIIILYKRNINIALFSNNSNNNNNNTINDSTPKVAFLFLTYNNLKRPDIWNKFFDIDIDVGGNGGGGGGGGRGGGGYGYTNKYTIYNHAKESENITDILLKDRHISEHVETCWGCIGSLEANILMMKEALKDPMNKKFVLVSESCIPIVSFDTFYKEIMQDDKSRIKNWKTNNTFYRYSHITNPDFPIDNFVKHNGQGLVFNRKHAELLVNSLIKYKDNWKNVEAVDEHYFGNILQILDNDYNLNNNSKNSMLNSYVKDEIDTTNICNEHNKNDTICEPHNLYVHSASLFNNISNDTVDEIRSKGFLFIRKVDNNTKIDIEYILR